MVEKIISILKNSFFHKNRLIILDLLLILWVLYVLFPLQGVGFISDDSYNSQIAGKNLYEGLSFWQDLFKEIKAWLIGNGRLSPFAWFYTKGLYSLQPSPYIVKSITLAIIALNVLFYSKIIHFITKNTRLSYICGFMVPLLFQFRMWHDPIIGFAFMIPLLSMFLFASLLVLTKYLEKNEIKTISLFLFLHVISLCTYELSYIFIVFYILIVLFSSSKKNWGKPITLAILATASHFFIILFFKESGSGAYPGSNINFNFEMIFSSFLIQVTSAFPLSWKIASGPVHESLSKITYSVLIIFAIFSLLITKQFYKIKDGFSKINSSNKLLIFSLALLLLPAVPVALTGHQAELVEAGYGYGYIVVFMQYFGAVALFLMIVKFLKKVFFYIFFPFHKLTYFTLVFFIIFSVGYFTRLENSFVAHEVNKFYKYPRDLIKKSINIGILDHLSGNSLLIRNERYPSDHYWFYSMKAGRKMNICGLNRELEFPNCVKIKEEKNDIYGLAYFLSSDYKTGSVFVAKLDRILLVEDVPISLKFNDYKVYNSSTGELFTISSNKTYDLLKIAKTEVGAISLDYNLQDYELDKVEYGFKSFHDLEGNSQDYLRWSSGSSIILIENNSDQMINKRLTLRLIRPGVSLKPVFISVAHLVDSSRGLLKLEKLNDKYPPYLRFLDWFIYDYVSLVTEKLLASMYWEEGDDKEPLTLFDPHGSMFKFKGMMSKEFINSDIIKNIKYGTLVEYKSQYLITAQKEISIILKLKPGINYVKLISDSPWIDNGDPRKIVFGIGNYRFDNF